MAQTGSSWPAWSVIFFIARRLVPVNLLVHGYKSEKLEKYWLFKFHYSISKFALFYRAIFADDSNARKNFLLLTITKHR